MEKNNYVAHEVNDPAGYDEGVQYFFELLNGIDAPEQVESAAAGTADVGKCYDAVDHTVFTWLCTSDDNKDRADSEVFERSGRGITPGKDLLIRDEDAFKYVLFSAKDDYAKYATARIPFTHHEVIFGWQKQKLKFDIDGGDENAYEQIIADIDLTFEELYPTQYEIGLKLAQLDSSDATKFSRHVVITNWCVENNEQAKAFYERLKENMSPEAAKFVDWNVNKSTQCFRMLNSVKKNRKMRVMDDSTNTTFTDTLITFTDNCTLLPRLEVSARQESGLSSVELSQDIIESIKQNVDKDVWSYKNRKNNILEFNRIKPSHCDICQRNHTSNRMYITLFDDCAVRFCYADENKPKKGIEVWRKEVAAFSDELEDNIADADIDEVATAFSDESVTKADVGVRHESFEINGKTYEINQELIDRLIGGLGDYWKDDKKFLIVVRCVKRISLTVVPEFNPDYLLFEFPTKKYEKEMAYRKWKSIDCGEFTTPMQSLLWLQEKNPHENSAKVELDVSKFGFNDAIKLLGADSTVASKWMHINIRYIMNNGEPFWVMKSFRGGLTTFSMNGKLKGLDNITISHNGKKVALKKFIERNSIAITKSWTDFIPTRQEIDSDVFNLFPGFKHKYDPTFKVDPAVVQPMLTHLREIICNGSQEVYDYALKYFAHILQRPEEKPGVAMIWKSNQGAGKQLFLNWFSRYVMNDDLSITINDVDMLTGRMNAATCKRLLTVCDEMRGWEAGRTNDNKMKNLITDDQVMMKQEYVPTIKIKDFTRYVMLSNNANPMNIEAADRRYLVLECNNKYAGNEHVAGYHQPLVNATYNDNCGLEAYHYFMSLDLTGWQVRKFPDTAAKQEMKMDNLPYSTRFMIDYVRGLTEAKPAEEITKINLATLYTQFERWCQLNGVRQVPTRIAFSRALSFVDKPKQMKVNNDKIQGWELSAETIREKIKQHLKNDNMDLSAQ